MIYAISLIDETTNETYINLNQTFNSTIDAIKSVSDHPCYDKKMIDLSTWVNYELENMNYLFMYDPNTDEKYWAITEIPLPK